MWRNGTRSSARLKYWMGSSSAAAVMALVPARVVALEHVFDMEHVILYFMEHLIACCVLLFLALCHPLGLASPVCFLGHAVQKRNLSVSKHSVFYASNLVAKLLDTTKAMTKIAEPIKAHAQRSR